MNLVTGMKIAKLAKINLSMFVILLVVAVFSPFYSQAITFQSDWPMFHNDASHSGYSTTILPLNLVNLWNYSMGKVIFSDVVVSNGFVYFTAFGNPIDDKIFALNASTGSLVWVSPTSVPLYGGSSPAVFNGLVYTSTDAYDINTGRQILNYSSYGGSTAPTVAQGIIYVGSSTNDPSGPGGVFALDSKTGTILWNFTGEKGNYPFGGKLFYSPAVTNHIVYFSSGGGIYALDALTGHRIWHNSVINASLGSLGSISVNDKYVFDNVAGQLYCLDALSGNELWRYEIEAPQVTPAVANGFVYAGSYKLNASNGDLIWNNTLLKLSSPTIAGDKIYSAYYTLTDPGPIPFTYNLNVFNDSNGQLLWNYTFAGRYSYYFNFSPAIADGMLFISTSNAVFGFAAASNPATAQHPDNSFPLSDNLLAIFIIILAVAISSIALIVLRMNRKQAKSGSL
jgi:outer membrane protein assembly factor BamB